MKWDKLFEKKYDPPFKPNIDNKMDTKHFDKVIQYISILFSFFIFKNNLIYAYLYRNLLRKNLLIVQQTSKNCLKMII